MRRFIFILATCLLLTIPVSASNHFAWGADVATSIDAGGHDMSSLDINAYFGYKNSAIDLLGIGAGINMMVSNSCRAFPLYAILRTSFRSAPSLCFLDFRGGCAIDALSNNSNQTVFYVSPGIGFNLARTSNFRSYFVIGYTYNALKSYGNEYGTKEISHGLHLVNARIGITF